MKRLDGRNRAGGTAALLLALAIGLTGCSSEPASDEKTPPAVNQELGRQSDEVPLVTLEHWRDSTPGERYAFLIGFVTMLELEKEWQGREGRSLKPFEESLVGGWAEGLGHRPLAEIYNGLNGYLTTHPGDLSRPVAEVMWFLFVRPRQTEPDTGPQP